MPAFTLRLFLFTGAVPVLLVAQIGSSQANSAGFIRDRNVQRVRAAGPRTAPITETVLYTFFGAPDGYDASGPLIIDKSGTLYGTTYHGGANGFGMVYKLTPTASKYNETILYNFQAFRDGANPSGGLILGEHGEFYGTTQYGGEGWCGCGTVFELTPAKNGAYSEKLLYAFQGAEDGGFPSAVTLKDGELYGTTPAGGYTKGSSCPGGLLGGCGTVFKVNPATLKRTVVYRFQGGVDGNRPQAALVASAGALYGTASSGGDPSACPSRGGCGVVFKVEKSAGGYHESVVHAFDGSDGEAPAALVLQKRSLIGVTAGGGAADAGTAFAADTVGSRFSTLYNFGNGSDDPGTNMALLPQSSSTLFGASPNGGSAGCGAVFDLKRTRSGFGETVAYSFQCGGDGRYPSGSLISDVSGDLYGVTTEGGFGSRFDCYYTCGVVYEITCQQPNGCR